MSSFNANHCKFAVFPEYAYSFIPNTLVFILCILASSLMN